ncbi:hypothetical protein F4802DRAFT_600005 [Xylaria palmicola]|nr:hypothetical protein F4802DRAFT_600005 [Xylaria palmicola]
MALFDSTTATSRASAACVALSASFAGQVTVPGSADYQLEEDKPWSQTCWLPAACFVHPNNSHEVATCLSIVKSQGSKFAVRSSAHHSNANFNSVDSTGVVIDVSNLKTLSLVGGNIVQVGAGCTFGELYDFVEDNNLYVVSARNLNVSILGFALGGKLPHKVNILPFVHTAGGSSIDLLLLYKV